MKRFSTTLFAAIVVAMMFMAGFQTAMAETDNVPTITLASGSQKSIDLVRKALVDAKVPGDQISAFLQPRKAHDTVAIVVEGIKIDSRTITITKGILCEDQLVSIRQLAAKFLAKKPAATPVAKKPAPKPAQVAKTAPEVPPTGIRGDFAVKPKCSEVRMAVFKGVRYTLVYCARTAHRLGAVASKLRCSGSGGLPRAQVVVYDRDTATLTTPAFKAAVERAAALYHRALATWRGRATNPVAWENLRCPAGVQGDMFAQTHGGR